MRSIWCSKAPGAPRRGIDDPVGGRHTGCATKTRPAMVEIWPLISSPRREPAVKAGNAPFDTTSEERAHGWTLASRIASWPSAAGFAAASGGEGNRAFMPSTPATFSFWCASVALYRAVIPGIEEGRKIAVAGADRLILPSTFSGSWDLLLALADACCCPRTTSRSRPCSRGPASASTEEQLFGLAWGTPGFVASKALEGQGGQENPGLSDARLRRARPTGAAAAPARNAVWNFNGAVVFRTRRRTQAFSSAHRARKPTPTRLDEFTQAIALDYMRRHHPSSLQGLRGLVAQRQCGVKTRHGKSSRAEGAG